MTEGGDRDGGDDRDLLLDDMGAAVLDGVAAAVVAVVGPVDADVRIEGRVDLLDPPVPAMLVGTLAGLVVDEDGAVWIAVWFGCFWLHFWCQFKRRFWRRLYLVTRIGIEA